MAGLGAMPAPRGIAGRTSTGIGFLDVGARRQPTAGGPRLVDERSRFEAWGRRLIDHAARLAAARLAAALRRDGIFQRPKIVANRHDLRHRRFDPYQILAVNHECRDHCNRDITQSNTPHHRLRSNKGQPMFPISRRAEKSETPRPPRRHRTAKDTQPFPTSLSPPPPLNSSYRTAP